MDMFNTFLKGFIRIREQNREDFKNFKGGEEPPSDFDRFWKERDDDVQDDENNQIIIPSQHRGQFVFGDMFSMMGEMFKDMERSMGEMDRFFTNEFNDNMHQQPQQPHKYQHPDPSISPRDQMLKKGYVRPATSDKDKVDTDFDDLTKSEGFDKIELPIIPNTKEKSNDEIQVYQPCPKHGNSGRSSRFVYSFSQFNNKNGVVQGKEIKETNEGREVTTFKTNENGEVENQTEFYPKDSSTNGAPMLRDHDDNDLLDSQNFFSKLFKPRM